MTYIVSSGALNSTHSPEHIVSTPTLESFRRRLKTFILQQFFCLQHFSGPCSGFDRLGHFKESLIDWLI